MQNTHEQIFFNFSYFALKLLGKGLYSNPWTAISELVANGLDAKATNVKILIDMSNKESSTIEIFDCGHGMGYHDLANKYVLIGRNRRDDNDIDEITKRELMGRKGIGKLAALYLSNCFYLISKTEEEHSAWCLDMTNINDSDIPSLNRINDKSIDIKSNEEWEKLKTGTMIKLLNVDLTSIGFYTIEGLKARLADFYLLRELKGRIEISVINSRNEPIVFSQVGKSIAFKNFYAFYNNTSMNPDLSTSVYISSSISSVNETLRPVQILDVSDFAGTSGKQKFMTEKGALTEEELTYEMKGWIGIHTSIQKNDAIRNDSEYLRNKAYHPNQLRLYVRNKLAVENFLDYLKNTQVFNNYIEGEISFDILDSDVLGDIATSNRQDFIADDERVQILINILRPIINALINSRVIIGKKIRAEEETIREEEKREEEEARKKAEEEKRKAEEARKKAEKEKTEAETARRQAEKESEDSKKKANRYHEQNKVLFSTINEDQESFAAKVHLAKTNALAIKNSISTLAQKIKINDFMELESIAISSDRILSSLKYSALAKFNIEDEYITEDIFIFIEQLIKSVLARQYSEIRFNVSKADTFSMRFSPQNIALVFDNLVSNSKKSNSTIVNIDLSKEDTYAKFVFSDNGDGFPNNVDNQELFEFALSYTGGTGIGLYNVSRVVKKMRGSVIAESNITKGARFTIKVK